MLNIARIMAILSLLSGIFLLATDNGNSFWDNLDSQDQTRWAKSDGWSNGGVFEVGWRSDHINFGNGIMTINLDNLTCPGGCSNQSYASGEYRSLDFYGYGCYEASMKPAKGSGLISSFFTYKGPFDIPPGGNGTHNEIDIEFMGNNTSQMQVNFFTNDSNGHELRINLGYDAVNAYHIYAFKWLDSGIQWFVDGKLVHSVNNSISDPTPTIESGGPQKIMMNLWSCSDSSWCGPFSYSSPISAQYDWVKYQSGLDCNVMGTFQVYLPNVSN